MSTGSPSTTRSTERRRRQRHYRPDQRPCRRSALMGLSGAGPGRCRLPRAALRQSRHRPERQAGRTLQLEASRRRRKGAGRQDRRHRLPSDGRVDGRHDRRRICAGLWQRPQIADARLHLRQGRSLLPDHVCHVGRPRQGGQRALRHARRGAVGIHRAVLRRARRRRCRICRRDGVARHVARGLSRAARRHPEARRPRARRPDQGADAGGGGRGGHPHPGAAVKEAAGGDPRRQVEDRPRRARLHVGDARPVQHRIPRFRTQPTRSDSHPRKEVACNRYSRARHA